MTIAEDLKRIRAALCSDAPFFTSLLHKARILESKAVPTVGVDERTNIYINPDFWANLSFQSKTWIMGHEVIHAAFLVPQREKAWVKDPRGSEHLLWNIAADAVANNLLEKFIRCPDELKGFIVTPRTIAMMTDVSSEEIEKMSVEEIFRLLLRNKDIKIEIEGDIYHEGLDGTPIQGGDPIFERGSPSEIKEAWKEHVSKAYMAQKCIGTVPEELERCVGELIEPAIDPRSLIRRAIRYGLGKLFISDWRRPSRRHPDFLPWIRKLKVPSIWALVDTSGSISEEELSLFLGTVYEFAKQTKIHVICWDAKAYKPVTAQKPAEVISKVCKRIRGGGGTVIRDALEKLLPAMKKGDAVLVLTDMEIYDLHESRVQELLATIAAKASVCAFCTTTDKRVTVDNWRVIKLAPR
jgi:predicted metal-dependent peptidase